MVHGIKYEDADKQIPLIKFHTQSGEFEPSNQVNLEILSEARKAMSSTFYFYGEKF